jgi:uncharacterized protein (UPF0332 family)
MAFDWNNFLILAEEIATRGDEASKRTAISRAYYFVFHLALARAELTAGPFRVGENSHRWCWERYQDTYYKTRDKACNQLWMTGDRMKRRRVKADYKQDLPRLEDEVRWTIEEAREFLVNISMLNANYPLP